MASDGKGKAAGIHGFAVTAWPTHPAIRLKKFTGCQGTTFQTACLLLSLMNLRSLAVLLLAIAWCVSASAADSITTPEKLFPQLDVILRQTVAQSPRMVSRALDLEMSEQDRIAARAALLPSVTGSYRLVEARDDRSDLSSPTNVAKQYYDFSLSQPIFHWGERKNTARIGEIRNQINKGSYREAYRLLANEVRTLYLTLILDKVRSKRTDYYRDYVVNQQKLAEERLAKKVIAESDIFNIRLDAERAQISAEQVRFAFENDKASFARLTGAPVLKDDDIPDEIPPLPEQNDAIKHLLAGFLSQKDPPTAEADSYRQSMSIEKLNLANQKTRLRPKFNLVVGTSQDEQSYKVSSTQKYRVQSIYGGVSIYWTIFDGFAAGAAVRSYNAKIRQMENDYRGLTERLAQQAQTQAQALGYSTRLAVISDRLYEAGRAGLRTRQEDYRRGVVSEEDLSKAQITTYDAQYNALAARGDYYNQLAVFLGTVMEDPVLANLKNQ